MYFFKSESVVEVVVVAVVFAPSLAARASIVFMPIMPSALTPRAVYKAFAVAVQPSFFAAAAMDFAPNIPSAVTPNNICMALISVVISTDIYLAGCVV